MKASTREMMEELKLLLNLMNYEVYESVGIPYPIMGSFFSKVKKIENITAVKNDVNIRITIEIYPTFKQFSINLNGSNTFQCQATYDKCNEVRDKIINEVKKVI